MSLFYTPEYAKTGDVIPFYNEKTKRFEGYYLKNWNKDAPEELVVRGWHRIVSEDNRHFEEMPTNIEGGTGSIVYTDGVYHMFYCTFDFPPKPLAQWARHAVSEDLIHWTDFPEEKFTADGEIYAMSDWRDPHVFWNEEEQKWWMLLAARENHKTQRNGCVALCVSDDLHHWEYRKPLYGPKRHPAAYECPDLFKMGDWYYLVYSSYVDGFHTYYRMSKSPAGPWIRPALDTFDGRAFYAAKTAMLGESRYIYGWNPSKGENNWEFDPQKSYGLDYQTWNWGGAIVVHKLVQHEDGTLGVCATESVATAFDKGQNVKFKALSGEWVSDDGTGADNGKNADNNSMITNQTKDGYSAVIGPEIPETCKIKMTVTYHGNPSDFGVALQVDEDFDFGYYLMFEPAYNRIQFRSGLRMYEGGGQMFPYAVEMERPLIIEEGREYELELYIEDSIGVLYINHDVAFGMRMYNYKERNLGFYVCDGTVEVKNAMICEKQC